MKKLFSKLRIISQALSMATILLALPSCKSVNPCLSTIHRDSVAYTIHQTIDTIVMHDSVYVREVQRGDTVYLTRTEWRDRWRVRVVHDTVRHTEYVDRVVEKPPERYVPKFYKWCTGLFWAIIAGVILYYVLKIVIRYYLRK